jgi:hypothetical protein
MAIMRDDGSTDWRTVGRSVRVVIVAVVAAMTIYLAGAWVIVMNTSWCPSPWTRLDQLDGACVSPM